MKSSYRVFLGAPSLSAVLNEMDDTLASEPPTDSSSNKWQILEAPLHEPPAVAIHPPSAIQPDYDASRFVIADQTRLDTEAGILARRLSTTLSLEEIGFILPERTFAEANERLSKLYENVIFRDDEEEMEAEEIGVEKSLMLGECFPETLCAGDHTHQNELLRHHRSNG